MGRFRNFVALHTTSSYFDALLIRADNPSQEIRHRFSQTEQGFVQMREWLQMFGVQLDQQTLFCMGSAVLYHNCILSHLVRFNAQLFVRLIYQYKKQRNEMQVQVAVARYAMRFQAQLKLWVPTDENVNRVTQYGLQRSRIINAINNLTEPVTALKYAGLTVEAGEMKKMQEPVLASLKRLQLEIESMICKTVLQDEQAGEKRMFHSVKNFAPFMSWKIMGTGKRLLQLR